MRDFEQWIEFVRKFVEVILKIAKEGINWQVFLAAIPSLLVLFRINTVRRLFPWIFKPTNEVKDYVGNQAIIMENQRLIMEHLGVKGWDAEKIESLPNTANKQEKSLLQFGWVTRVFAIGARLRTTARHTESRKTATRLYFGRSRRMKEYLKKLGRTKFQAFLIATLTNIGLLLGYVLDVQDVQSKVTEWTPLILAASQLVAGAIYQYVEGGIDKEKAKAEVVAVDPKESESHFR